VEAEENQQHRWWEPNAVLCWEQETKLIESMEILELGYEG
jgi:hypothetical protein